MVFFEIIINWKKNDIKSFKSREEDSRKIYFYYDDYIKYYERNALLIFEHMIRMFEKNVYEKYNFLLE